MRLLWWVISWIATVLLGVMVVNQLAKRPESKLRSSRGLQVLAVILVFVTAALPRLAYEAYLQWRLIPFQDHVTEYGKWIFKANRSDLSSNSYTRGKVLVLRRDDDKGGPFELSTMSFELPSHLHATSPSEVGTVVFVACRWTTVGYYRVYKPGEKRDDSVPGWARDRSASDMGDEAKRHSCSVTVIDTISGVVSGTDTEYGGGVPQFKSSPGGAIGSTADDNIVEFISGLPHRP